MIGHVSKTYSSSAEYVDSGHASHGDGPVEDIGGAEDNEHDLVEEEDEVHKLHVLFVDVVRPDGAHGHKVVGDTKEEVEKEKEEEALVL